MLSRRDSSVILDQKKKEDLNFEFFVIFGINFTSQTHTNAYTLILEKDSSVKKSVKKKKGNCYSKIIF